MACLAMPGSTFPIARVVVEQPVPKPLDYQIPDHLRSMCQVGQRVMVPLGQRDVLGYIVELTATPQIAKLKDLLDVVDSVPIITPDLLQLTRWVADYYTCAWGQVLKAAIPAGFRIQTATVYSLSPIGRSQASSPGQDKADLILRYLAEHGPQTRDALSRAFGQAKLLPLLRRLQGAGLIYTGQRLLRARTGRRLLQVVRLCLSKAEARQLQHQLQHRAPTQAAVLSLLQQQPNLQLSALQRQLTGARSAVKRLQQRSAVKVTQIEQMRQVVPLSLCVSEPPLRLNTMQQQALTHIHAKLRAPDRRPILLHGVTGSGKTEVYMQAIAAVLEQHKSALVLTPEISLTGQMVERFAARYTSQVAVLHSGLSDGERFDEWRRLASGKARIAIGARSAVFAPLPRLGLIIIDEEHDTSYKQEETPRYNARDVAIVRAHQTGALALLGSATPALETFHHAETGKYQLLALPKRVEEKPLPQVTVIDQRLHADPGERVITTPLCQAIATRLERREQCLILMNRRGFASYLQCRDCGEVPQCMHCSVSLTYHRHARLLKCHYCDFTQSASSTCASCQSVKIQPFGIGTQQVEEVLKRLFPNARLARMDRDTTRRKAAHQQILNSLRQGEIDILVGTQMIAKGHDFPNITLVGVVAADATLAVPDFRAPERLFQLLTQVAGRAGRGHVAGDVIIQTYRPDHYSIQFAKQHDFLGFFKYELELRRPLLYPPYARLARLLIEGASQERVQHASQWMARVLQRFISEPHQSVLGPAEAPIARINNRYRWHFLLKAATSRALHQWLQATLTEAENQRQHYHGSRISVDMDPMSFI